MMSFSAPFIRTARACFALRLPDPPVRAASVLQPDLATRYATGVGLAGLSFLLAFIFLFPSFCAADISMEPRIGFHGVFQLGHPFPLEVEIKNSGGSAEGRVDVRVWKGGATKGGAPYPFLYRREIFVPAQARKTVEFTVDPDFVSRPLTITFSSRAGESRQEVDLRRYFSPAPVMLLVSESASMPPISLAPSSASRLVALSLAELPADPRAWLGVSHLILYDQSLRDLSHAQLVALDGWLVAGGNMVILGSLNYALYQGATISRFLPVRVTGAKRIAFIPPLGKRERAIPRAAVWVQASTPIGGKILAETDGLPLLVDSRRGKGRITYFAFDVGRPPLSEWNGLSELLQGLLAPAVSDDSPPRTRWDDTVFSQLMLSPSFASAYIPTGSLFLAICGYLLGMGIWAWLWQRKQLTGRNLFAVFAGFIAVAVLGGYILFSRGGNVPDGVLLSATVIESGDDGYVDAQSNLALFSTQLRRYSLQPQGTWMNLAPVSTPVRERPDPIVVLQAGDGSSRYQLELREWDHRLFRMRSVARFPLRAEFQPQGDKLFMTIENRSAKDLTDCWLVLPARRYAVGDIPRGATRRQTFPLTLATANDETSTSRSAVLDVRDLSFADKTRDALFHASFFPRDGEVTPGINNAAVAVFLGWVKDPEPRVRVADPRVQAREYTLFRATIPLAGPEDE
jgi:hypothetical protein